MPGSVASIVDGNADRRQSARARPVGLIGLGALCALLGELVLRLLAAPPKEAAPTRYWVADREAGAVFGLDADLFVTRRVSLRSPVAVEVGAEGDLWVLSASEDRPSGSHRLARVGSSGGVVEERDLPGPARLASDGAGGVLCCAADASRPVIQLVSGGEIASLDGSEGATCAAAGGGTIAFAGPGGVLHARDLDGGHRQLDLQGGIRDLVSASCAGGWWVLVERESQELCRISPALEVLWSFPSGLSAPRVAPVPGEERVWLCDPRAALLRRFGRGGVEIHRHDPALAGVERLVANEDGEVLAIAPGGVLRFDRRGAPAPGQGGFAFLSDAAWVPERRNDGP